MTIVIESDYNLPPIPKANGPYNGNTGQSIQFSSSGSKDPNTGDTFNYYWEFGDGSNSTEQNPTHKYSKANRYIVYLTLTDQDGEQGKDSSEALIKTKSEESPGFETILVIISILGLLIILKKRTK